MIDFKRILFPVDFSDQSRAVAPFVKAMAACFGSEVTVLHVIERPVDVGAKLNRFLVEELSGIQAIAEMTEGDAARGIVDYARDRHVDLIMMPTHGHGLFRALLLGSVTAKVLHDAHCPVWTGVHAEKMTEHSQHCWKRVLCALDTEGEAGAVLQWASEFAGGQNMELRVVHSVAGADAIFTEEIAPGMYEFLFHAAREKLAGLEGRAGTSPEIVLMAGNVGSVVHGAALEWNADLIVIGRGAVQQSLGRLWSHAYSIIREAPCPVISRP